MSNLLARIMLAIFMLPAAAIAGGIALVRRNDWTPGASWIHHRRLVPAGWRASKSSSVNVEPHFRQRAELETL